MPYDGEFAQYRSIKRITESDQVKELLLKCEVHSQEDICNLDLSSIVADIKPSQWFPKWIIAVDGSNQEIPIVNGFPGAEVSYLTVSSVMLNVEQMRKLDEFRPVNPKEFKKIEEADSVDAAFPSCNVVMKGELSAKTSLRKAVYNTLKSVRMSEDGETLLDTYEALLKYKTGRDSRCPIDDCPNSEETYLHNPGEYSCVCHNKSALFSTDALRIHEGMVPHGTNGAMFAEIRQVLEVLWVVHVLRTMEQKKWISSLKRLALFLDGPLAVFGHPAWLSESIFKELRRINDVSKRINEQDILLVGIEKSGMFLDHFVQLDKNPNGSVGRLANQTTILLNDAYIKKNIIYSQSAKMYGEQTYFGRKFFYKTKSGALIVASLPFFSENGKDLHQVNHDQFPRLADALNLLDELASSRYPNALIPIISAHAEAAIPMNLGRKILEQLARELVEK